MFLRRLSTTAFAAALLRRANDGVLLAALRAEIAHEFSSSPPSPFPSLHSQDIPNFTTVSDAPRAQDVLLRRRCATEEVLVSALLAPLLFEGEEPLPRDALMKVFVSKAGGKQVVRFDLRAFANGGGGSTADYDITAVCHHSSPGDSGEGPDIRNSDPKLQIALKEYLLARGVNSKLASSLLQHLLEKERAQYVNWLKSLEEMVDKYH